MTSDKDHDLSSRNIQFECEWRKIRRQMLNACRGIDFDSESRISKKQKTVFYRKADSLKEEITGLKNRAKTEKQLKMAVKLEKWHEMTVAALVFDEL